MTSSFLIDEDSVGVKASGSVRGHATAPREFSMPAIVACPLVLTILTERLNKEEAKKAWLAWLVLSLL